VRARAARLVGLQAAVSPLEEAGALRRRRRLPAQALHRRLERAASQLISRARLRHRRRRLRLRGLPLARLDRVRLRVKGFG
jgi:hypothetical protein